MFKSSHVVSVDLGRHIVIGRWLMYMINVVTVMSNHPSQKRSLASRSPSQGARGALGDSQALYIISKRLGTRYVMDVLGV